MISSFITLSLLEYNKDTFVQAYYFRLQQQREAHGLPLLPDDGIAQQYCLLGLLVNPKIRLNLQIILHQWPGSLKISESGFLNFVFQIGGPLEASRNPPSHLPLGARLGSWLHLTSTHADFLKFVLALGFIIVTTFKHVPKYFT